MSRDERLHYHVLATLELVFEQSEDGLAEQLARFPRHDQFLGVTMADDRPEIVVNVWSRSEVEVFFHIAAAVAKDALAGIGCATALRILDEFSSSTPAPRTAAAAVGGGAVPGG